MVADIVRADALHGYSALVRSLGGDPDALAGEVGLALDHPAGTTPFIPYHKLAELLHLTARATARPDFGLLLAASQGGTAVLGPLEVAMRNSPTLGDAFDYFIAHAVAFSAAVSIVREEERETGRPYFRFEMYLSRLINAQQIVEHAMGLLHHVIIALSGGKVRSRELWFAHDAQSPIADYRRYFGTRVEMNMPYTALFLSESDLAAPLPDRAQTLFDLANAYIDREYSVFRPLSAQVRSMLTRQLAEGATAKAEIARRFSLHPRTLDRRLRDEGSSFRALVEEVRRDAAYRYLTETALPVTGVAAMVGYSEPAVLTRRCRQWFGCTPRALRTQAAAAAPDRPPDDESATRRLAELERENARLRRLVEALLGRPGRRQRAQAPHPAGKSHATR